MDEIIRRSQCACGRVRFEGVGKPILCAVCYCVDCQEGGRRIESLPGALKVRDDDGGTPYLIYRTDRFRCVAGDTLLSSVKLQDRSLTQRLVAKCCNTGMALRFEPGHWISAYRRRFEGEAPPIEMRNQVQSRKARTPFPDDAPRYRGFPAKLIGKLLGARLGMLLGR